MDTNREGNMVTAGLRITEESFYSCGPLPRLRKIIAQFQFVILQRLIPGSRGHVSVTYHAHADTRVDARPKSWQA
jgi:hypothetical protein